MESREDNSSKSRLQAGEISSSQVSAVRASPHVSLAEVSPNSRVIDNNTLFSQAEGGWMILEARQRPSLGLYPIQDQAKARPRLGQASIVASQARLARPG